MTDRRAVIVTLTKKGRSLVSQSSTRFEADVTTSLDGLPPADRNKLTDAPSADDRVVSVTSGVPSIRSSAGLEGGPSEWVSRWRLRPR